MALKPWYQVIFPREDLRSGKPLDAAEFAVHLDQVRDGRAPLDYQDPARFFERTYLTDNLTRMAAEVVRRLSGEKTETSAVFNLTTQFGGGKTHALTLLYHLAVHGPAANSWTGVSKVLAQANVPSVPQAAVAVFVGMKFDSLAGRGGNDGTPHRQTPWGEIAFQLGGAPAFQIVARHDEQFIEPKGDVIRAFLPKDKPCLILIDELLNYVSTYRKLGYGDRLYNFLQALSEEARSLDNVVLVGSIPASELEYTTSDEADQQRFSKMLDRLGKSIILSAEGETAQIIRRRLFEFKGLPPEAWETVAAHAAWVVEHRLQLPNWFPIDHARDAFAATYPFHPLALSVFERKWQSLPRFQRTRGVLRLLALWIARAYQAGYTGAHRDPLITLGTAPLDDPLFRAAVYSQLGEERLEAAVVTDICGKADAHAARLDEDAVDTLRQARLHRKVATTIFFESNGGQLNARATLPEVRLAVADPDLDIGNVETVLEALRASAYYLSVEGAQYWFSFKPNLNKLLADRRASIKDAAIEERVRAEIQSVFSKGKSLVTVIYFPELSNQIPDRAALTLSVLSPERHIHLPETLPWLKRLTSEAGMSGRTHKSALLWAVAEDDSALRNAARNLLAWEEIRDEQAGLSLDEVQQRQLKQELQKARDELTESVWRTYKNLVLLGKDNELRVVNLGLIHSSAAETLVGLMLSRLRQDGDLEDAIGPAFLVRYWPPAFEAWSTAKVSEAFFASPQFPRLLDARVLRDTIAKGVTNGFLAYAGQTPEGEYTPFFYKTPLYATDVEISDAMVILKAETADAYLAAQAAKAAAAAQAAQDVVTPPEPGGDTPYPTIVATPGSAARETDVTPPVEPGVTPPPAHITRLAWRGDVPSQKWMNFYMKVLSKFATGPGLRLHVQVTVDEPAGISVQRVAEMQAALRELGLEDEVAAGEK
ncbi:MAG TPA: DUF499 domain-containing protein [Anaerolineae bacterium]|nr:DUF499 domain-containing protein [Anaerolineae bacterium]HQI86372.1 DUF499 domain-containing protein [Anaerolineae bacterium]